MPKYIALMNINVCDFLNKHAISTFASVCRISFFSMLAQL